MEPYFYTSSSFWEAYWGGNLLDFYVVVTEREWSSCELLTVQGDINIELEAVLIEGFQLWDTCHELIHQAYIATILPIS